MKEQYFVSLTLSPSDMGPKGCRLKIEISKGVDQLPLFITRKYTITIAHFWRFYFTEQHSIYYFRPMQEHPGNFCLWNPESWALESGIQLKESGIPLTIGIQNPSSTDKDWNPVPSIRNPRCGIQNSSLSWILLHGAIFGIDKCL